MFEKFFAPTLLDLEIRRVLVLLRDTPITDDRYGETLDRLNKLHKMRAEEKAKSVSKDQLVVAATNLVGILIVVNHEYLYPITSKAFNMVHKPKA